MGRTVTTVAVPVFNAPVELEACLASLRRTLPASTPVLLINDASTDARVAALIDTFVRDTDANLRVSTNDKTWDSWAPQIAPLQRPTATLFCSTPIRWFRGLARAYGSEPLQAATALLR